MANVTVRLAHPLGAADAQRLGLLAREYHVGEQITVSDDVAVALDGNGLIQHGNPSGDPVPPPADILPPGTVMLADLSQEVLDAMSGSAPSTPDATTSVKGKVQLAGDLSGVAATPTVVKVRGVAITNAAPTAGQVLTASSGSAATWATPSVDGGTATTVFD